MHRTRARKLPSSYLLAATMTICLVGALALAPEASARKKQATFDPGAQAKRLQRKARWARAFGMKKTANRLMAQGVVTSLSAVNAKLRDYQKLAPRGQTIYVDDHISVFASWPQAKRSELIAISDSTNAAVKVATGLIGKPGFKGEPIANAAQKTLNGLSALRFAPQRYDSATITNPADRAAVQSLRQAHQALKTLPLGMAVHDAPR